MPGELRGYKNGTNRLMKFQPEKPDPKYWEYLIDDESDLAWAEWLYYKLPTPYWKVNVVIVEEVAGKRNASKIALCKVAHYRNEAPTKGQFFLRYQQGGLRVKADCDSSYPHLLQIILCYSLAMINLNPFRSRVQHGTGWTL